MKTPKSQLKAVKKFNKSEKGKINQAKQDKKRTTVDITGIQQSTKQVFNSLKESKGYTADQLLRELLNLT
jgi:hypothetical protein